MQRPVQQMRHGMMPLNRAGGDQRLLKRELPRLVPAHDLPMSRLDEQKRRRAFVVSITRNWPTSVGHAPAHEAIRDPRLVRPSRRKTAFDRGRRLVRSGLVRAELFRQLIRSPENRSREISLAPPLAAPLRR